MPPLRYKDLLDIMMQRADRIGLVDSATQKADAVELEIYLFHALLSIVEMYDINDYTIRNDTMVSTQTGVDTYGMPADFGRLIAQRPLNRRGIFLNNGAQDIDLEYLDPNVFIRQEILPPQTPTKFTVMKRKLMLAPVPDSNNQTNYTVHGVYIEQPGRPDLDEPVLLPYPTVLIDEALFILAGDIQKLTPAIQTRRTEALAKLQQKATVN